MFRSVIVVILLVGAFGGPLLAATDDKNAINLYIYSLKDQNGKLVGLGKFYGTSGMRRAVGNTYRKLKQKSSRSKVGGLTLIRPNSCFAVYLKKKPDKNGRPRYGLAQKPDRKSLQKYVNRLRKRRFSIVRSIECHRGGTETGLAEFGFEEHLCPANAKARGERYWIRQRAPDVYHVHSSRGTYTHNLRIKDQKRLQKAVKKAN